ncbi:hypothetical protein FRC19_005862 [Serendipita sp. 401]|nr:hypothetical protein FRC19_005862 [Serendipita sp. 401]KAG9055843.1 hypothetical protein FS842_001017 [Serendipita sp. 407]
MSTSFLNIETLTGSSFVNAALKAKSPPGSTFVSKLDQAINVALPFTTSPESSLNRNDVLLVDGPSGSGKTELLYYLAMTTILPFSVTFMGRNLPEKIVLDLGSRGKSVVVCDCDGCWSMSRLRHIMEALLEQRFQDSFPNVDLNDEAVAIQLQEVLDEAMDRLHLFRPISSGSLAATLHTLPQYHYKKMKDEEICMLMIDGMSSFYWQDRWKVESTGGGTWQNTSYAIAGVIRTLQSFRESHNPVTIITNWALSPLSSKSPFFKQHLPPPFPAPFEKAADGTSTPRISPLEVTHHITLINSRQSPLSQSGDLPEDPNVGDPAEPIVIQGIVRTPPKDIPDTIINHFEFLVAEAGVTVLPIEEAQFEGAIELAASPELY